MKLPMEQIESRLDDLRPNTPPVPICQAGKPARLTAGPPEPCQGQMSVLEGGTSASDTGRSAGRHQRVVASVSSPA
jgi:hypothetical protein